jgi:pimeloyl-ACP methyl ester carboxylesterase
MSGEYTEQAVQLGSRRSLVGIFSRPRTPCAPDTPTVVILNTGVVHRVGHHRMYVTLSRQLAAAGHQVLRFDFSGIGDSAQRTDQLSPLDSSLSDIHDVMESLEKNYQVTRVVLVGLCSGADHAVLYANRDPRIVGLVLMDPSIPPTARYYAHYIVQRLTKLQNWISVATLRSGLLRQLLARAIRGTHLASQDRTLSLDGLRFSPHLVQCYRSAVVHRVRMLGLFTAISPRATYRQQMRDAFPGVTFGSLLKLEFFPDSDHLFTAGRDRTRLASVIMEWLGATRAA